MNALIQKELRLLLPAFLAVAVLSVALPWIGPDRDEALLIGPLFFFFGIILLAVDSFGREFSLGTFSALMAQPVERRKIWRAKIGLLLPGALLIYLGYFASCELRLHLALNEAGAVVWQKNPVKDFGAAMLSSVVILFVALSGGLWTSLLLRQISAAFWISFLAPLGFAMALLLSLPEKYASDSHYFTPALIELAVVYTLAGFWLAHRLFYRAQDAGWSGGVISFSRWRYFETNKQAAETQRVRRPIIALLKKEFQLHSITLFCVGSLLILHLLVFLLRIFYVGEHPNTFAQGVSDLFWTLWLIVPLLIGGTAVSEERKLTLADSQFCLPVSRGAQFLIKFIPVTIGGLLLGGATPFLLESAAAHWHAPCDAFRQIHPVNEMHFALMLMLVAVGITWVSFFASTLARNFLQALSITIVIVVVFFMAIPLVALLPGRFSILGILPWPSLFPILIGAPTALAVFFWMLYRNYHLFNEGWRLWRGNILGVVWALLFVFASSTLLYHRVWEIFEPAEPAHGSAKFSPAQRPKLLCLFYRDLQVHLADGRVWCGSLTDFFADPRDANLKRWKLVWRKLTDPRPISGGPSQFVGGSYWTSVATEAVDFWNANHEYNQPARVHGFWDTVGVKADGTLWISSRAEPQTWTGTEMIQVGSETNWQQVARFYGGFTLLKNDGTLWLWSRGTNRLDWNGWQTNWPTVRQQPPRQIGDDTNWSDICNPGYSQARKTDGSLWWIRYEYKNGTVKLEAQTNFLNSSSLPFLPFDQWSSRVGTNGTLWVRNTRRDHKSDGTTWITAGYLQVGTETNWVAVTRDWPVIALKTDGTLWTWPEPQETAQEIADHPPRRLGIHSDWLGLVSTFNGAVTLAADGSLWYWNGDQQMEFSMFKPSKQPKRIGNVFE